MIEDWKNLSSEYINLLKWTDIYQRSLRTEPIDYKSQTDYMDCPICKQCVASDSIMVNIQAGSYTMTVIELQNPELPSHKQYLIWMLNKHLQEVHGTIPENLMRITK